MDEAMFAGSGETAMESRGSKQLRKLTMTEGLRAKKERLEQQLAEVNEAIEALEAHPEIEKVLHLVSRAM